MVAASLPLLLREVTLLAVLWLGQVGLLGFLVPLDRLARRIPPLVVLTVLVGALQGDQASTDVLASSVCVAGSMACPSASVEVVPGRARIRIEGPAVLDLPVETMEDERVAIVLCRLPRSEDGRPLLPHAVIAAAFGKKHSQDSTNRFGRLKAAGGSIARMILDGRPGRPSSLHPDVQALLAVHWQRDPLASLEQTSRWLAEHDLDVPPLSPGELRDVRNVPGNLVVARNALARLLQRRGRVLTLALRPLHRLVLAVVDEQDRRLREAGVEPVPFPGVVGVALDATREPPPRQSKTGRALMASLQALVRSPSPEEDEQLAAAVGAEHVAPLHWGLLYCRLRISFRDVGALVGKHTSTVYRGITRLARCVDLIDPFPPAARFSGVLVLDEKWVQIPKSFSKAERAKGKQWRYVHFAVDAHSGQCVPHDPLSRSLGAGMGKRGLEKLDSGRVPCEEDGGPRPCRSCPRFRSPSPSRRRWCGSTGISSPGLGTKRARASSPTSTCAAATGASGSSSPRAPASAGKTSGRWTSRS